MITWTIFSLALAVLFGFMACWAWWDGFRSGYRKAAWEANTQKVNAQAATYPHRTNTTPGHGVDDATRKLVHIKWMMDGTRAVPSEIKIDGRRYRILYELEGME